MKNLLVIVTLATLSLSAFAVSDTKKATTKGCVQEFALNAALPDSFPPSTIDDQAGDRIFRNIMDEETKIHAALKNYCIKNGNIASTTKQPETTETTRCIQSFALEAALPYEFPGLNSDQDPVGDVIYKRVMSEEFLVHKALASYCKSAK